MKKNKVMPMSSENDTEGGLVDPRLLEFSEKDVDISWVTTKKQFCLRRLSERMVIPKWEIAIFLLAFASLIMTSTMRNARTLFGDVSDGPQVRSQIQWALSRSPGALKLPTEGVDYSLMQKSFSFESESIIASFNGSQPNSWLNRMRY